MQWIVKCGRTYPANKEARVLIQPTYVYYCYSIVNAEGNLLREPCPAASEGEALLQAGLWCLEKGYVLCNGT